VILLGGVLLACWWVQRNQTRARFLLWMAAAMCCQRRWARKA
jgi:hypothetical protein